MRFKDVRALSAPNWNIRVTHVAAEIVNQNPPSNTKNELVLFAEDKQKEKRPWVPKHRVPVP